MKRFLILLIALFIMQTVLLKASDDRIWAVKTHDHIGVEFSPNSYLILSHGRDAGNGGSRMDIIIFNTEGDTVNQIYSSEGIEFIMGQGIWDAHFSQDGRYLATIWEYDKDHLSYGMLEIYETENWLPVKRIEIPGDMFSLLGAKVLISPDNNTVVAKTMDGFYFYDVQSGELIKHIWDYGQDLTKNIVIAHAVYSKDGSHIYFTSTAKLPSSESKLRFLNTQTFEVDYTRSADATFNPAISNDGRMLAFPSYVSGIAVEVMDIDSKEIVRTVPGFVSGTTGIAFSKDNQYLAVAFQYQAILEIYNISSGERVKNLSGTSYGTLSYSYDDKYIITDVGKSLILLPNTITSVNKEKELSDNIIYPNPANNSVNIKFDNKLPGIVNIILYNEAGKLIKTLFTAHLDKGEQNIKADINGIKSGNYLIKVSSVNTSISFKLIINK